MLMEIWQLATCGQRLHRSSILEIQYSMNYDSPFYVVELRPVAQVVPLLVVVIFH